jgi:2-polyprenyl-6-methoxyphenol hydroxylase-like FAD-dependent oxidoreductase
MTRYGYPLFWIARTGLLKVLYNSITDKSKILTQKRIASVQNLEDAVEVTTTDGSVYSGDILVGTDGVHSRVREEMIRHAKEQGIDKDYDEDHSMCCQASSF